MKVKKTMRRLGAAFLAGALLVANKMPVNVKAGGSMDGDGNITLTRFESAPTIDGVVTPEEWGQKIFTIAEGQPFVQKIDQEGVTPPEFTADVYLGYDSEKFYIAAVADYENHVNEALLPSDIWQGACMQIQISATPGTDRNEMGFTYNSLTKKQQATAWSSVAPFTMEGGEGKDYYVFRDGTKTVYEIAIPVNQFSNSVTELKDGMTIAFSMAFPMSGGGFYEFKDGIVSAKDINLASLVGLGTAPDAAAAVPGDDGAPQGPNVSTNLIDERTDIANRTVPGQIEAEDYDLLYGTETKSEECAEGTLDMGFTSDGDYFVYKNVNFTSVPDTFSIRTAGTGTPKITVLVDGLEGTKVAEFNIEASGDWQTWITNTVALENKDVLTGIHDVYVLINGGMNLNWISFDGKNASEPGTTGGAEAGMDEAGNITLTRFGSAPVIDGVVSEQEWGQKIFTIAEGQPFVQKLDQEGVTPPEFTADIYLGYDSEKFYIAAVADYENHVNEALLPSDIWQGACMQIQISATPGTDRNEMGFTYNSLTKKQQATAWSSVVPFTMEGGEGQDYYVFRDGTRTVYEIALPVNQFSNSVTELRDGMTIAFSVAFPMSGGGFYEFKEGIVSTKNITLASLVGLGTAPDTAATAPGGDDIPQGPSVSTNLIDERTDIANRTVPGQIEAEDYDLLYGTETKSEECSEGTLNMGFTSDGDYFVYKNVNFTSVPDTFSIRTAGTGTPKITVLLDGLEGTKVAEFNIEASGDWQTWITTTVDLENKDALTGTHDVYLLINGGMNLNWICFDGDSASALEPTKEVTPEPSEAPTPTPQPTPTTASEPTTAPASSDEADSDGGSNTAIVIVIIVVVVVAVAVFVAMGIKKKKEGINTKEKE